MRKFALFLLLVLVMALGLCNAAVVAAFFHAGGTILFVVLLVGGALFFAERARRC